MGKSTKSPTEAPAGKIVDFIDGKPRTDSDTEQIRQDFERTLIEEYRYERSDIGVDVHISVQEGTRIVKRKASLIVYQSADSVRDDNSAHVIIQVVKQGTQTTDTKVGTDELERMMIACPGVRFGCWTNGTEAVYFQKKKQKFDTEIFPVNDFPRKGEDDSAIFTTDRSRLRVATGVNLLAAFKRCHDFIHANQGGSKEQIFWEFLKILFAKIEDEQDEGRPRFAIRNADERNTHAGQREVKDRVEVLFRSVKLRKEYKGLFDDAVEGIRFNADVVAYIVAQLEKYDFLRSSVDVKGMAYETIVGPTLEGVKGEFFTPRNVVKMIVKILDPNPGDRILDPACGTGGFIVVAFNYVSEKIRQAESRTWRNFKAPSSAEEKELFKRIHESGKTIFGIDFNANLVKTAQMNMVMNNDGRGGLFCVNSLLRPSTWPKSVQQIIELGTMDLVMTNPPFGTKIKIEGQDVLEQYDLAHIWRNENGKWVMDSALRASMPPEVLFIERCVQFLKPGSGCVGMIVPNGILGTPEAEYVRHWILSQCQVLTSVQLPVETFLPRTGTQTSVLALRRLSEQEKLARSLSGVEPDYNILMSSPRTVGKNRRAKTQYLRDDAGLEIFRPDLYDKARQTTLLEFAPLVETNGKVVDDDLWVVPAVYRSWQEKGRPASNYSNHRALSEFNVLHRCESTALPVCTVRRSSFRLNAESYTTSNYYLKLEHSDKELVDLSQLAEVYTVYLQSPILAFMDEPREGVTKPFYSPSDLQKRNPRVRHVSLRAEPRLSELQVKQGWLLLSGSGTVGQVTLVTQELDGAVVGGDMLRIVPKQGDHLAFLYFYLSSVIGAEFFTMKSYGSVVEHLHPDEVRKMKIPRPPKQLLVECANQLSRLLQFEAEMRLIELSSAQAIMKATLGLP